MAETTTPTSYIPAYLQKNQYKTWEHFTGVEIAGAWYSMDNPDYTTPRAPHESLLRSIAETSNILACERSLVIPFREGHPDGTPCYPEEDKPVEGLCYNFRVENKELGPTLLADIAMTGSILSAYQAGQLPSRSIGISGMAQQRDGAMLGPYLDHVAAYGEGSVAIPDLSNNFSKGTEKKKSTLDRIAGLLERALPSLAAIFAKKGKGNFQYETKEGTTMTVLERLRGVIKELEGVCTAIEEEEGAEGDDSGGGEVPDSPPDQKKHNAEKPAEEPKEEDEDMKSMKAKLKAQLKAAESERREFAFERLISQGKIAEGQRKDFFALCERTDLDFAIEYHSKGSVKTPPTGDGRIDNSQYKPGAPLSATEATKQATGMDHNDLLKKLGLDDQSLGKAG